MAEHKAKDEKRKELPAVVGRGVVDAGAMINRMGHTTLFVIERNIDEDLVVYEANRRGNQLLGVTAFWRQHSNWAQPREPVSDAALRMFYGARVTPTDKKSIYEMTIQCMPDRIIELHLKKSGAVIPKVVLNGKACILTKAYVDISKFPPSVNGLWVFGVHTKNKQSTIIEEEIPISTSVMDDFDVTAFIPKVF